MLLLLCQPTDASMPHTTSLCGGGRPPVEMQKAQSPVEGVLRRMFGYEPAHGPREVVAWGHVPKCPQLPGHL